MRCFFCRKETVKVIRCESCIGATKTPVTNFKGGGWAGGSVSLQMAGQSKSFDKSKAPKYKDLEKNGYLDYVKDNNKKVLGK